MLAWGAALVDKISEINKANESFHGVPLVTSRRVRLNEHMWKGEIHGRGVIGSPTVIFIAYAYVVPDGAMTNAVVLCRDG